MIKLDIGTTKTLLNGYTSVDLKLGLDARALPYARNSIDEIHASHVLEHLPASDALPTIRHWVDLLKPSGVLRIAVPNFAKIIEMMTSETTEEATKNKHPYESWIMGGQCDLDDFHKTLWTEEKLRDYMTLAGLQNLQHWDGFQGTFAADPISLNIIGRKQDTAPTAHEPPKYGDCKFAMTMPRLAWTDNMTCVTSCCRLLGIDLLKISGVFYGQCLQRAMVEILQDETVKWIITVDYDSLFDWRDIVRLRLIAEKNNLDMVAPIQSGRERSTPLFTVMPDEQRPHGEVLASILESEWFEANTMHFGLTMIRTEALRKMLKPWFVSTPDKDGDWGEARIDDDVHFWRQAKSAGLKFGICPSVSIGHIETVAAWSDQNLNTKYQPLTSYLRDGKPMWLRAREQWRYAETDTLPIIPPSA